MRKRFTMCLTVILLIVFTVSCGEKTPNKNSKKESVPETPKTPTREVWNIGVDTYGENTQYIRTHEPDIDLDKYPYVVVIDSVEEFNEYRQNYFDDYKRDGTNMERGFTHFNEEYFKNRILIVAVCFEGSGSIRHEVTNVCLKSEDSLEIKIDVLTPQMGTCDCAWWHILIEPAEGVYVDDESKVKVEYNTKRVGPYYDY